MATLGFHFFVLVLFGLLQAAPQAARAGFVQGSVIDAATGQPLKDATATLRFRGRRLERTMKTDEKGLFTFMDVEPGPYELKVEQPGYLSQKYGQVSYDIPLAPDLVVEAGGRYNVPFPMVRAAVVTGRVYDTNRQPVAKAEIRLLTLRYGNIGQRMLDGIMAVRPVNTDDRGEYRFEGVPPGDYYVKAAYRSLPANQVGVSIQANNIAATYYPGVTGPDEARTVRVAAGADVQAVDFSLPARSPFRVSGRIVNPFLQQQPPVYDFYLVPRDARVREGDGGIPDQDPATDKFEFRDVPRGSYDLFVAFRIGDPRTNLQIYSGRIAVEVVDRAVKDLTVVIDSGIDIKGEIKLDAETGAAKPNFSDSAESAHVQPLFVVTDGMPLILSPTAFLARRRFVKEDGTFEIPHVPFGRYRLLVSLPGPMRAYFVSAARLGTEDILGQVFEINSDTTGPLVVELSDAGGTMAGAVTGRGGVPVAGAQIVLVPPINLRLDQTAYKTATTNEQGRFTISTIRPGVYTAFAFIRRNDVGALMNAEFMAPYLNFGVPVDISKARMIRQDLTVIELK
jgi:protocatechuate 3,4-dioxygenase beta subunit